MSGDDLGTRLDRVVEISGFDPLEKTRLLRLFDAYTHASAIGGGEHDLSLAEIQPALLDLLRADGEGRSAHVEGLKRLLARRELVSDEA
ncbi:MAG: hypothetical protein U0353_04125 [Sandaracinus sp.]